VFLLGCGANLGDLMTSKAQVTHAGGPTITQAQAEPYDGPKARIAVARFTDKTGKGWWTGSIGDGMSDMLATALFNTNRFIVVERQILGEMKEEQELVRQGLVKPGAAAPRGQWEGPDLLITGAVTEFEPGAAGGAAGVGGGSWGSLIGGVFGALQKSHIAIDLRVVDTATRRVVAATRVEGSATDVAAAVGAVVGFTTGVHLGGALSAWQKTPLEKALRVALEEGVNFVVSKTPPVYYRQK
jgi:curli biogenesis system outer membrane secretion channel CsgG